MTTVLRCERPGCEERVVLQIQATILRGDIGVPEGDAIPTHLCARHRDLPLQIAPWGQVFLYDPDGKAYVNRAGGHYHVFDVSDDLGNCQVCGMPRTAWQHEAGT
jgi:hypothetical protein